MKIETSEDTLPPQDGHPPLGDSENGKKSSIAGLFEQGSNQCLYPFIYILFSLSIELSLTCSWSYSYITFSFFKLPSLIDFLIFFSPNVGIIDNFKTEFTSFCHCCTKIIWMGNQTSCHCCTKFVLIFSGLC